MKDDIEPRSSPLVSQVVLWVVFAALVVVSVFTVVLPELADDGGDESEGSAQPARETSPAARP